MDLLLYTRPLLLSDYQRTIASIERLRRLRELSAPESIILRELDLLTERIEVLVDGRAQRDPAQA